MQTETLLHLQLWFIHGEKKPSQFQTLESCCTYYKGDVAELIY